MKILPIRLIAAAILSGILYIQCATSDAPKMAVSEVTNKSAHANYNEYCASCHGVDARAFADRKTWVHGSDKASLVTVIQQGLVDQGMPSFEASFSPEETEALADYIIAAKDQVATFAFDNDFDDAATFSYNGFQYRLELITDQVDIPWGIAQTAEGDLYYTDISGQLYHRYADGSTTTVAGLPEICVKGQGGLLDVSLDPNYASNQLIYLTYSKFNPNNTEECTTAIFKGQVRDNAIINGQDIWVAMPYLPTQYHFGSRMAWDNEGHLYVSIGDRGRRDENPQNLSVSPGKIHRIHHDGSIPADNPYINTPNAIPSIYSYGHRNPQGLAYDKQNNILYENEHGPRGGDEINIVESKKNYGWPLISYGINYNGTVFTEKTTAEGMEQPIHYWVPAIGVCGLAYIDSPKYPDWKGKLLSGSLKYKYLNLSDFSTGVASVETQLFPNIGRLRSVIQGTDGYIYVGVEQPGRIYRILPQ